MQHYSYWITDSEGVAQTGVTVEVFAAGTTTPSTIYSDNGITPLGNPMTTDSLGMFDFFAANGYYDLFVDEGGAGETTIEDVLLFDPFDDNAADTLTSIKDVIATTTLKVPTTVPGAPAAGHVWEASGLLKHGSANKVLVETTTAQTLTNKTFSDAIISTLATGTAPFTVASTTAVTNLKADLGDSATAFFPTGNLELAVLPFGTANQVLGTNSGATAQEHKSLAVGSSGTDFAIAHTANTITFDLPSASAANRGLVTPGTQTLAGDKTLTGTTTLGTATVTTLTATTANATTLNVTGRLRQNTVTTFASLDATPSVSAGNVFKTANAGGTTIVDFDDGVEGQTIYVIIDDANTTIDFTGTNLKGNAGTNWSPTTNDHLTATYVGTTWYCNISDNSA